MPIETCPAYAGGHSDNYYEDNGACLYCGARVDDALYEEVNSDHRNEHWDDLNADRFAECGGTGSR